MTFYNNLPQEITTDSSGETIQIFDAYTTAPFNIDANTFDAMTGFFQSRGFGSDSAKSMAYIIIKQAISKQHKSSFSSGFSINPKEIVYTNNNQKN